MRRIVLMSGLALAVLASPMAGSFATAATKQHHVRQHAYVANAPHRTCGEGSYWSAKEGKCLAASEKAPAASSDQHPAWESQCMLGKSGC